MAADYTMVSDIRQKLMGAADAAAVGAVARTSPAFSQAGEMSSDGAIAVGEKDAMNLFKGQLEGLAGYELTELTAKVVKSGTKVDSTVRFTAQVPTHFMRILGKDIVTLSGTSGAENGMPSFSDFYLLLDNTPSMGLGATLADIEAMEANTPDSCAFACHETQNPGKDYYWLAKKLGITMRIDVLRDATAQLTDKAADSETYKNQYRMALYTFGDSAEQAELTRLVKLTSNLSMVKAQSHARVDLMTVPYQNYNFDQDTDFNSALYSMNKEISTPGTGSSNSSRLKYLFFVSDGVADYANSKSCTKKTTGGRCQEPINTEYCKALKDRGIRIAILYTTYKPLPVNSWYKSWIAPFQSEIGEKMSACASDGLYFEVSPTDGIAEAMVALFEKIIAQPRLTN